MGSSIACCWAGVEGQKRHGPVHLAGVPDYGTASRAVILSANHFLPFYDCLFSIHDQNFLHQCEVEDLMADVAAGRRRGVKLSIVRSDTGEESSVRHLFTSDDVRRVRAAKTPRLVELSKQEPFQAFLAEAAHLSTRLKIPDGLRGGAADVAAAARRDAGGSVLRPSRRTAHGRRSCSPSPTNVARSTTRCCSARARSRSQTRGTSARRGRGATPPLLARAVEVAAARRCRDAELGITVPMLGASLDAINLKLAERFAAAAVAADAKCLLRARRSAAWVERRLAVVPPDAGRASTATSSDYWGVSWKRAHRLWQAWYNDADGEQRGCGYYATQERAAVGRLRRIRREGVERKNRLNPIVERVVRYPARSAAKPAATAPAPAPTRASERKRTQSDLGAGSLNIEQPPAKRRKARRNRRARPSTSSRRYPRRRGCRCPHFATEELQRPAPGRHPRRRLRHRSL